MSPLAEDLARALDPAVLAQRVDVPPDPWQEQVLRSSADRLLLNCCRQSGKSTMAAILAVHAALYQPGSLSLMLSPSLRQSTELFRKAISAYRKLGRPVAAEAENALSLTLENGSRIACLPGSEHTVRGFSGVRLLVVDEAARVPDPLYFGVRPMLAVSGGRLIALSTPFGTRGWFYEAWRSERDWERYEVPADQCPRIPADFLEEERRNLGEWWFSQEYECRFIDAESAAFAAEDIEAAFSEEVVTWSVVPRSA